MATFAELSNTNIVLRVLVVADTEASRGQEFLADELGLGGRWIQSANGISCNHTEAGIGYTFDENLKAFIPPQPYPSWTLHPQAYRWVPPVPYPTDGFNYWWDEDSLQWKRA